MLQTPKPMSRSSLEHADRPSMNNGTKEHGGGGWWWWWEEQPYQIFAIFPFALRAWNAQP